VNGAAGEDRQATLILTRAILQVQLIVRLKRVPRIVPMIRAYHNNVAHRHPIMKVELIRYSYVVRRAVIQVEVY
jgi:hypothetical protein